MRAAVRFAGELWRPLPDTPETDPFPESSAERPLSGAGHPAPFALPYTPHPPPLVLSGHAASLTPY